MQLDLKTISQRLSSIRCVVIDASVLCTISKPLVLGQSISYQGDFLYIPNEDASSDTVALSFKTCDGFSIRNLFRNVLKIPVLILLSDRRHESIYRQRCAALHVSEFFCGVVDKLAFLKRYIREHGFVWENILLFDRKLSIQNAHERELASSVGLLIGADEWAAELSVPYVPVAQEPYGYIRGFTSRYLETDVSVQTYYDQTREGKRHIVPELFSGSKPVRALILDIDGTCTNACRIFSEDGREWKRFGQKDLQALRQWVDSGKILCFLTGENNNITVRWAEACGIDPARHLIQDASHLKVQHLQREAKQFHLQLGEIAYMGDDTNDLGVLEYMVEQNGFAACPQNAVPQILNIPGIHLMPSYGGSGACVDLIRCLLSDQGIHR